MSFWVLMPNMDGRERSDVMRRDPTLANIPIIMSTSHPAGAPPAVLLIRKPVDVQVLIDAVNGLLPR